MATTIQANFKHGDAMATTITLPNGQTIALGDWVDDQLYTTVALRPARCPQTGKRLDRQAERRPGWTTVL